MSSRLWKKVFARAVIWACLVGGVLLLFVVGQATWSVYQKERGAVREYTKEAEALTDLLARKASLKEKLSQFNTERGIEELLRERFPVAKVGEAVIVVVNEEEPSPHGTIQRKENIWQLLLRWFGF